MQYAPIAPPAYKEEILTAWTNYHFALGQELVRDPEYLELYKEIGGRKPNVLLIVDNGAAEFDQVAFKQIVEVCTAVGATEIIMPDQLYDSQATIAGTCSTDARRLVPPTKRMIVPQGRHIQEWITCLHALHTGLSGWYVSIGIPKHVESMYGGRPAAIRHLVDCGLADKKKIHLLGAYRNMILEARACTAVFPGIRGIDSAEPVAHAQNGIVSGPTASHVSVAWKAAATDRTKSLAARNIDRALVLLSQQGGSDGQ